MDRETAIQWYLTQLDMEQYDVEMQDRMEKVTLTLAEIAYEEAERSQFEKLWDSLSPCRNDVPHKELFELWMGLWNNPEEFEQTGSSEHSNGDPFLLMFRMGVVFGIDYEQAFPEDENEDWPIPVDKR